VWQFFTYGFIHVEASGLGTNVLLSLFWFIFVMYMLYQCGSMVEAQLGPSKLVAIYVASEAFGGLLHVAVQILAGGGSTSGILAPGTFALFMYAGFLWPNLPIRFFFLIPMTARMAALVVYGIYLFLSAVNLRQGTSPFAVVGAMSSAWAMLRLEPKVDRWLDRRSARAHFRKVHEERSIKERVDQILDKISREGMDQLTSEERRILKQASEQSRRNSW
jgi:membrane associated rhomboid family serine protease